MISRPNISNTISKMNYGNEAYSPVIPIGNVPTIFIHLKTMKNIWTFRSIFCQQKRDFGAVVFRSCILSSLQYLILQRIKVLLSCKDNAFLNKLPNIKLLRDQISISSIEKGERNFCFQSRICLHFPRETNHQNKSQQTGNKQ